MWKTGGGSTAGFTPWPTLQTAGADEVLALKGNQPPLLAPAQAVFATGPAEPVGSYQYQTLEKKHGRIERRACPVTDWLGAFGPKAADDGPGLRCLVQLERQRAGRQQDAWGEQLETSDYFSSLPADAALNQTVIRHHRSIENQQYCRAAGRRAHRALRPRPGESGRVPAHCPESGAST